MIWQFIRGHFDQLNARSKRSYFWRVWLETTLFAYIVGNLLQGLFHFRTRTDLDHYGPMALVTLTVIAGPIVETVIFQCLPLEFAESLKFRRFWQFALSIVPFAIGHLFAGIPTSVSAGVIGGFYFAFTYSRWKRESLFVGLVMTILLHSSFNLVGALAMLARR